MTSLFKFTFDVSKLDDLVNRMGLLSGEDLVRLQVDTVNRIATEQDNLAKDFVTNEVNLPRAYVEENIQLRQAQAPRAVASVVAPYRNVTLGRFDATQHAKPVIWSNARIEGMGKEFSDWPGWTRRTGDALRGIDADYKAAGVDVTVKRGRAKDMNSAFMLPLRNGGGRMGVFVHNGGRLKHLYGPAVYQLYRNYLNSNEESIIGDMQDAFVSGLDNLIDRAL